MIAWGHSATGAIIGAVAYNFFADKPILGLVIAGSAGLVSHYLLDLVPHGHFVPDKRLKENLWKIVLFDFLLSAFIFLFAVLESSGFGLNFLFVFFGIIGAVVPDCFNGIHLFGIIKRVGLFKLERKFHEGTHWFGIGEKLPMLSWIDLWQVATVFICLYLIVRI